MNPETFPNIKDTYMKPFSTREYIRNKIKKENTNVYKSYKSEDYKVSKYYRRKSTFLIELYIIRSR